MAFCQTCGTQIPDGYQICAACANAGPVVPPPPVAQNDVEANKGMAVLAYILFFVPLIAGTYKTSPFVKYHLNQGIILWILSIGWAIVENILMAIFWAILPFGIASLISVILSLASLFILVLLILGIMNAVKGETKPLPVVGGMLTILK